MAEGIPGSPYLTVTELARRLGRPPSTVRYWRNRYRDALEERLDEDGRRAYRLADFEGIDLMVRRRVPPAEIRRALSGGEPDPGLLRQPFETTVVTAIERLIAAVERIDARLAVLQGEREGKPEK